MNRPIKAKERETIIQSLKSGVVPRAGLQHIQVGRSEELKSFIKASIRLQKGLVTMHADLSPTKRLHGSDGQPRMLLSEMVGNLATRTKPDGNALQNILERFVSGAKEEAAVSGRDVYEIISEKLSELNDYTGGYNFISVIKKYLEGYEAMVLKLLTWLMIRKYDSFFSENLYSFRPHYGAKHALRRLLDDPESSQYHSYKLDVRNYFNSIDVSMMLPILERLLVDDKPLYKFLSGLLLDPRVIDEGNMVEEQKGLWRACRSRCFWQMCF